MTAALQTVTRGRSRSLRRRNEGLVSFTIEPAPAAPAAGTQDWQHGMWIMITAYLILLLMFPSTVLFLSAITILAVVGNLF